MCWLLEFAAGTKVVAVGDSVESMSSTVAADAGKGVDCVGCACNDSDTVVGEHELHSSYKVAI